MGARMPRRQLRHLGVHVGRRHIATLTQRMGIKAYNSVSAARADIADYIGWYNASRAHSRLADRTPDEYYFPHLPTLAAAA